MPNTRMAKARQTSLQRRPCGIIKVTALCALCRYRHKAHWTKAESRLARNFGAARFGDEGYAMEELVAELGAAFIMAEIGHQPAIREDHAPYIAVWLKALKRDHKAILTAAAKASDALDYLAHFQPNDEAAEQAEAA